MLRPVSRERPIVPSGGIWRPTFQSGNPATARQRRNRRSGSRIQQSAASARVRVTTSSTRRRMTDSKLSSLVRTWAASISVSCWRSRRSFSPSRRAVEIASPTSRATASASAISPGAQRLASGRCRSTTPIMRSNTRIGVASAAFVPSSRRACRLPSAGSPISFETATCSTATVRRSRAARFVTGSREAASPTGSTPSASHSATTGMGSPGSPSLMKHRLTPTALAVSSTATWRTVSRSSSERTRRPISATRRSRSSATRRASLDRARPSARAASLARPWTSSSSAAEKSRC